MTKRTVVVRAAFTRSGRPESRTDTSRRRVETEVDWSFFIGTALGSILGLAQATVLHRWAVKEAASVRKDERVSSQERLLEQREFDALSGIVEASRLLPPMAALARPSDDIVDDVRECVRRLEFASLQLRDDVLRDRVLVAALALDLAKYDRLNGYALRKASYVVKHMVRDSVGSAMRKEALPAPSDDWEQLRASALAGQAAWIRGQGSEQAHRTNKPAEQGAPVVEGESSVM